MSLRYMLSILALMLGSLGAAAATDAPVAITRLQLEYTAAAQKQADDDTRFSSEALRKSLGEVLATRGLANLASDAVVNVAAIEVDEFDVRATGNVVFMGRVASLGVLGGTVRIRDGAGRQLRELHVRAEVPLKVRKNATDRNALVDLYREFANLIADEITGTVRSAKPARQRP